MTLKPLDVVGVQMYTSEVRDLVDSLRYRIHVMRDAQTEWVKHEAQATAQAEADPETFDRDSFAKALNAATQQQTNIFDLFESFCAAWARLSLLFYPIDGKGEMAAWRVKRGELLRAVTALPPDTLLADRSFRDSWMHFDERMDLAFVGGWLGNRQQFVRTALVPRAAMQSVRVIDVEALAFHYRDRDGAQRSVTIDQIDQCLDQLSANLVGDAVGRRIFASLPKPQP